MSIACSRVTTSAACKEKGTVSTEKDTIRAAAQILLALLIISIPFLNSWSRHVPQKLRSPKKAGTCYIRAALKVLSTLSSDPAGGEIVSFRDSGPLSWIFGAFLSKHFLPRSAHALQFFELLDREHLAGVYGHLESLLSLYGMELAKPFGYLVCLLCVNGCFSQEVFQIQVCLFYFASRVNKLLLVICPDLVNPLCLFVR
jgi:hypothetical protein